jgi:hypothetical protein
MRAGMRNPNVNLLPIGMFNRGLKIVYCRPGDLVALSFRTLWSGRFADGESEDIVPLDEDGFFLGKLMNIDLFRIDMTDRPTGDARVVALLY